VARFPSFEFTSHVFAPRRTQFGDDIRILCREPVLKLVESFDGRENGGGNFNGFPFRTGSLSRLAGNGKDFPFHGFFTGLQILKIAVHRDFVLATGGLRF
jgi:hypothetical protein